MSAKVFHALAEAQKLKDSNICIVFLLQRSSQPSSLLTTAEKLLHQSSGNGL